MLEIRNAHGTQCYVRLDEFDERAAHDHDPFEAPPAPPPGRRSAAASRRRRLRWPLPRPGRWRRSPGRSSTRGRTGSAALPTHDHSRPSEPRAMDAASLRLLTRRSWRRAHRRVPAASARAGLARPAAVVSMVAGAALVPARPALGLALLAGGGFLWAALHDPTGADASPRRLAAAGPLVRRGPARPRHRRRRQRTSASSRASANGTARSALIADAGAGTRTAVGAVPRPGRPPRLHGRVAVRGRRRGLPRAAGREPAAVPVSLVGHDPIEVVL